MNFDTLDAKMRVYETAHDYRVPPGVYIVTRLDGRGFTRLTKETHSFDAPFDARFRDLILETTEHLMTCGFRVSYAYVQSDEISLLLDRDENLFGRKTRKYNSVLAGEASAKFSLLLGAAACFDCRVCELPDPEAVVDYFRWRNEDAHRNALSAHCYWLLRKDGRTAAEASGALNHLTTAEKNELLLQKGVNFTGLPAWQKWGMGLWWETYQRPASDPRTAEPALAVRRRVRRELELPGGDDYAAFLLDLLHPRPERR